MVWFQTGVFQAASVATDPTTVSGLPGRLSALFIYGGRSTTPDLGSGTHAWIHLGFAASTTDAYSEGFTVGDNLNPTQTRRQATNSSIVIAPHFSNVAGNVPLIDGKLNAITADGFTLSWNIAHSNGWYMYYMAIGGSDVSAYVSYFKFVSETIVVASHGLNQKPSAMICVNESINTWSGIFGHTPFSFGMTDGASQYNFGNFAYHNGIPASARRFASGMFFQIDWVNSATIFGTTISSLSQTGVGVSYGLENLGTRSFPYLALAGVSSHLQWVSQPTSNGNQVISHPAGFTASAVIMMCWGTNRAAAPDALNADFFIGTATAPGQEAATGVTVQDNVTPSVAHRTLAQSAVIRLYNPTHTLQGSAHLVGFSQGQTTINWTEISGSTERLIAALFLGTRTASAVVGGSGAQQSVRFISQGPYLNLVGNI